MNLMAAWNRRIGFLFVFLTYLSDRSDCQSDPRSILTLCMKASFHLFSCRCRSDVCRYLRPPSLADTLVVLQFSRGDHHDAFPLFMPIFWVVRASILLLSVVCARMLTLIQCMASWSTFTSFLLCTFVVLSRLGILPLANQSWDSLL